MIKTTDEIDNVYGILDDIEMPRGQKIFIPQYKRNDNIYVRGLSSAAEIFLGQLISEKAYPDGEHSYTLLPASRIANILSSRSRNKAEERLRFLCNADCENAGYEKAAISGRETVLVDGKHDRRADYPVPAKLFRNPVALETAEGLIIDGESRDITINMEDGFDTLKKHCSVKNVRRLGNGEPFEFLSTSDGVSYSSVVGTYDGSSNDVWMWMSPMRFSGNIAVFQREDSTPKFEKMKVSKKQWEIMQKDMKRFRKIKSELETDSAKYSKL